MKSKLILVSFIFLFLFSFTTALDEQGKGFEGRNFTFIQTCSDATWMQLSTIQFPDRSIDIINTNMTSYGGGTFGYNITNTITGRYDVNGISDGCVKTFATYFEIGKSNLEGASDTAITLILIIVGVFNWFVVYRMNRFLGNMVFVLLGIGIIFFFVERGEPMLVYTGIIVALISSIKMIYDLVKELE